MGEFTPDEHREFIRQLETFLERGWLVDATWGVFSMALPCRTGMQCRDHFLRLAAHARLLDRLRTDQGYQIDAFLRFETSVAVRAHMQPARRP